MKISTTEELRKQYNAPSERAVKKSRPSLDKHSRRFIENSPFAIISTADTDGNLDTSPRGGAPGFIKVLDDNTLLIPDAKGNNRLDSLANIVLTGQFASLFLIPGMDETLRVNGRASISTDPEHLDLFRDDKNPPATCICVQIEEVFLHCAKALMRSRLWDSEAQIERKEFPTMGEMLSDQLDSPRRIETQEEMVERYKNDL